MENMMKSYNLSDLTDDDYYSTGLMTLIIYIYIQDTDYSSGTIHYTIPVERLLFHYWTGLMTLIIILYTGHWLFLWHYTLYNTSRTITIPLLNWSNNSNHIYRHWLFLWHYTLYNTSRTITIQLLNWSND